MSNKKNKLNLEPQAQLVASAVAFVPTHANARCTVVPVTDAQRTEHAPKAQRTKRSAKTKSGAPQPIAPALITSAEKRGGVIIEDNRITRITVEETKIIRNRQTADVAMHYYRRMGFLIVDSRTAPTE